MKKLTIAILTCLMSFGLVVSEGEAASQGKKKGSGSGSELCVLTPLQDAVRTARDANELSKLAEQGGQLEDPSIRCGGSLLQIAIRRGNPDVVSLILSQNPARAKENVSMSGFYLNGAPASVPVVLFAAAFSPSENIFRLILEASGDVMQRDETGKDITWYLSKNPVLADTDLSDEIQDTILSSYGRISRGSVASKVTQDDATEKQTLSADKSEKKAKKTSAKGAKKTTAKESKKTGAKESKKTKKDSGEKKKESAMPSTIGY